MTTLRCLQITPSEQGLRDVTQLVATFPKGFMTWQGPIIPLVILCHPDMVRTITNASGTYTGLAPALFPSVLSAFFLFSLCIQTRLLPLMPSVPALVSWAPLGPQEVSIQGPVLEEAPILRRQIWTERSPTWCGQELSRGGCGSPEEKQGLCWGGRESFLEEEMLEMDLEQ